MPINIKIASDNSLTDIPIVVREVEECHRYSHFNKTKKPIACFIGDDFEGIPTALEACKKMGVIGLVGLNVLTELKGDTPTVVTLLALDKPAFQELEKLNLANDSGEQIKMSREDIAQLWRSHNIASIRDGYLSLQNLEKIPIDNTPVIMNRPTSALEYESFLKEYNDMTGSNLKVSIPAYETEIFRYLDTRSNVQAAFSQLDPNDEDGKAKINEQFLEAKNRLNSLNGVDYYGNNIEAPYFVPVEEKNIEVLNLFIDFIDNLKAEQRYGIDDLVINTDENEISIATEKLKDLCYAWLETQNFNVDDYDLYKNRINSEIEILNGAGYSPHFIELKENVLDALNDDEENIIALGNGRGSACNSLVAMIIGAHNVDPIQADLDFRMFCDPQNKPKEPDIDINIAANRITQARGKMGRLGGTRGSLIVRIPKSNKTRQQAHPSAMFFGKKIPKKRLSNGEIVTQYTANELEKILHYKKQDTLSKTEPGIVAKMATLVSDCNQDLLAKRIGFIKHHKLFAGIQEINADNAKKILKDLPNIPLDSNLNIANFIALGRRADKELFSNIKAFLTIPMENQERLNSHIQNTTGLTGEAANIVKKTFGRIIYEDQIQKVLSEVMPNEIKINNLNQETLRKSGFKVQGNIITKELFDVAVRGLIKEFQKADSLKSERLQEFDKRYNITRDNKNPIPSNIIAQRNKIANDAMADFYRKSADLQSIFDSNIKPEYKIKSPYSIKSSMELMWQEIKLACQYSFKAGHAFAYALDINQMIASKASDPEIFAKIRSDANYSNNTKNIKESLQAELDFMKRVGNSLFSTHQEIKRVQENTVKQATNNNISEAMRQSIYNM